MTYTSLSQVPPSISRQMQNDWRSLDDKWHYIQSRRYNNNVYFRIYTCTLNSNKQTSVGLT